MNIQISELAAAALKLHLLDEEKEQPLAFQFVLLTSGCNTPSFALELIEVRDHQKIEVIQGIPFIDQSKLEWVNGLVVDLNRSTGNLSIFHPNPSFLSDCQRND